MYSTQKQAFNDTQAIFATLDEPVPFLGTALLYTQYGSQMHSCASGSCSSGRTGVPLSLLALCLQFPLPLVAFVEAVSISLESC